MANPQYIDIKTAAVQDLGSGSGFFDLLTRSDGTAPVAAIVWVIDSSGGTGADGAIMSIGFWDGTNERCAHYRTQDSTDPTNCTRGTYDDCVAIVEEADGSAIGKINVTATYAGIGPGNQSGLQIELDSNISGNHHCGAILFFGASVEAAVGTSSVGPTVGSITDITSPGFEPKIVYSLCGGPSSDIGSDIATALISMGIAVNKGTASAPDQHCVTCTSENGVTNGNTRSGHLTGESAHVFVPSGAGETDSGTVRVRDFDANGFSYEKTSVTQELGVIWLAINFDDAVDFDLELRTIPSLTAPDNETVTSVGFEVAQLFSLTHLEQNDGITNGGAFAFGFSPTFNFYDDTNAFTIRSQHGLAIGERGKCWWDAEHNFMSAFDPRGGPAAQAEWSARDANGYEILWTTIGTSVDTREYVVLSIQNVPAVVAPTGIASGEAMGTPSLAPGAVTVQPTGIASGEAMGTPTLAATATIDLFKNGIASGEAMGTPTLQATNLIAPGAIPTGEAMGTPVVLAGTLVIEPGGIASGEALGAPVVLAGVLMVQPPGIASGEALGTPTVLAGTLIIAPGGIASGEALGTPTLVAGLATVQPSGIASGEALGTPTVVAGAASVFVVGIASGEALGTPTLTSTQTVQPSGIASGEALGAPVVLQGVLVVQPSGIASGEALGAPTLAPGGVTVEPGGIPSGEALGEPTLAQFIVVRPVGIASGEALGLPTLTPGTAFVAPSGIASGEALGVPSILGGGSFIIVTGIASGEAMGTPFLSGGFIPMTLKKKIHDALIALAKSGTFVTATYDGDACTLEQGTQVSPESALANEVESAYARDGRHGRKLRDDRTAWRWELRLRFHQEVITELFEEAFLASPIIIPRDPSDPTSRQAIVSLLNARFEHPPQQGASNGTEVVFDVNAQVCPA